MLAQILSLVQWCIANYAVVISSIVAVITALIALFMIIPGEQPEKALKGIADFLSKFSKK